MDATRAYDAVIVGAGFSGLYMLHRLRQLGLSAQVYEAGGERRRHLVLEPLSRGARRHREPWNTPIPSRPSSTPTGAGAERYAAQPELLAYLNHVADRFDLRRDIQFETRVTAAAYDEATPPLDGDHRPRRAGERPLLHHGHRLPFDAQRPATCRASDAFQGGQLAHRPLAARAASTSPARRVAVIGTGSSAHPGDPADRRPGEARHRLPAHAQLQRSGAQRRRSTRRCVADWAGRYRAQYRDARRATSASASAGRRAASMPALDGRRRGARGGVRGALARRRLRAPGRLRRPDHRPRGQRHGRRVRAREDPRHRQGPARSPSRWRPTTYPIGTKRHVRRHRLLRDLQPRQRQPGRPAQATPIEAITADRRRDQRPRLSGSTPSSTPPASTP